MILYLGKDTYSSKGMSIYECLEKIKPTRFLGITKIELTINGKLSRIPMKFVPLKIQRIFQKDLDRELFAKRLQTLI